MRSNVNDVARCGHWRRPGGPGRRRASRDVSAAVRRARGRREAGAAVREWGHVAHVLAVALHGRSRREDSARSGRLAIARRRIICRPATTWSISYVTPLVGASGDSAARPLQRARRRGRAQGLRQGPHQGTRSAAVRDSARIRRDDRSARGDRCQRHVAPPESRRRRAASPLPGEREHARSHRLWHSRRAGRERARYAGKRVLVVGSGHSAFNVILDLLRARRTGAGTRHRLGDAARESRRRCGAAARRTRSRRAANWGSARSARSRAGRIRVLTPYRIRSIANSGDALARHRRDSATKTSASMSIEVIVCTGFRPDLEMLTEVRLVASIRGSSARPRSDR